MGRVLPDAFSLRSRDIIKVFIVTQVHCCKEFFLRPSCGVKSIVRDSVSYASEVRAGVVGRGICIVDRCRACGINTLAEANRFDSDRGASGRVLIRRLDVTVIVGPEPLSIF